MASRWVHETMDLIVFGIAYEAIHKQKDAPYKTLGSTHRSKNHEWYTLYGLEWNFQDLYPKKLRSFFEKMQVKRVAAAEELQVWVAHDILDKVWDELSPPMRKYWESFFIWLLFRPGILKDWAGVDVLNGRICRVVGHHEAWEACPEIKSEYERLRKYVEVVKSNDEILQDMLERFGQ